VKIIQGAVVAGLMGALCLIPASPSAAAPTATYECLIEFDSGVDQTVEYGDPWQFDVYADSCFYYYIYSPRLYTISVAGAPSGYTPNMYILDPNSHPGRGEPSGALYVDFTAPLLGAGTYTINIEGRGVENSDGTAHAKTSRPVHVTVTPTALAIDLRATADPNRPDATIISASLSGPYIDIYANGTASDLYDLPAGEWNIVVADDEGEIVAEYSAEATSSANAFAAGFYFTDAQADMLYSAKATFTPSGALAPSFTVSPSSEVSFTPRPNTRPVPTSTATVELAPPSAEETGLTVPMWALLAAGLLLAGLAVFGSVLFVRLRTAAPAVVVVDE